MISRFAGLAVSLLCLVLQSASAQASTLTTLNAFTGSNGNVPYGGLVFDRAGNLYGFTVAGGIHNGLCPELKVTTTDVTRVVAQAGCGVVFKLSRTGAAWTETVLHDFSLSDGAVPSADLLMDGDGNLYGAAGYGGKGAAWCPGNPKLGVRPGCGLIFKLTPPAAGQTVWKETILYYFSGKDGAGPAGRLAFDGAGNLYGTTVDGGTSKTCPTTTTKPYPAGCGVVFKLSPPSGTNENWTETVLHNFGDGRDGQYPGNGVILDKTGALYGTTSAGGGSGTACPANANLGISAGCGVVFRLSRVAGTTSWSETILDAFAGAPRHPAISFGELLLDKAGNIYGTTTAGGANVNSNAPTGSGTVFELSPPAAGKTVWKETILHNFGGPKDGAIPYAGLVPDLAGNLYGTTFEGGNLSATGTFSFGTVFKLSPAAGRVLWTETILTTFDYLGSKGAGPAGQLLRGSNGALYGTTQAGPVATNPSKDYGTVFQLVP